MNVLFLFLLFVQMVFAKDNESIFTEIWQGHYWGGVSLSGTGSDLTQTRKIREVLPILLEKYHCKTMLDAPCGDFYWMQHVALPLNQYIGADIVLPMILELQSQYGNKNRSFIHLDITNEIPPKADLIFCRDCLGHLTDSDIAKAISMFKRSGSTYLLTTSFPETGNDLGLNREIRTGEWRPIDLRRAPFCFPEPLEVIREYCTEWYDKSLFLWKIEDLPNLPF